MIRGVKAILVGACVLWSTAAWAGVDVTQGGMVQLEHEYWKNLFDHTNDTKDNQSLFRIKSSLWGNIGIKDAGVADALGLYVRLSNEIKTYPYYAALDKPNGDKNMRGDINEAVFDNLYLDAKGVMGLPLDLRLGRQDLAMEYGEGFLIMDGSPLTTGRTIYFNAAKAVYHLAEKRQLDFIYIHDNRDDDYLPIINENSPPTSLNTSDEEAWAVYYKDSTIKNLDFEKFYIRKQEEAGGAAFQAQGTELNTVGFFTRYTIPAVTLRGQLAYQFGKYGEEDRQGYGGYFFADKAFNDKALKPALSAGYVYLSGDDAGSSKMEAWDPLFSRWPWMSELVAYSYLVESGAGYWTNLGLWRVEGSLSPFEKTRLTLRYNYVMANETFSGAYFGTEKNRGRLYQAVLAQTINKNVSFSVTGEYFLPGDFYAEANRSDTVFVSTAVNVRF
jgi:hypothetical protein